MKLSEALALYETAMRTDNKSLGTRKQYTAWLKRYLKFIEAHSEGTSKDKLNGWVAWLVNQNPQPSLSNQKQAVFAVLYFYRRVMGLKMEGITIPSGRRDYKNFNVLNREQVKKLFDALPEEYKLIAKLLYGTGMRIGECLSLRVKDIDFDHSLIYVQEGKGDKARRVDLPPTLVHELRKQIDIGARALYEYDAAAGMSGVYISHLYSKKNPGAASSWEWFWVFPNYNYGTDPDTGEERRHHVYDFAVQNAFKVARKKARLPIYTTPHTLRHAYATHYIETVLKNMPNIPDVEDFAYELLRKKMGHVDKETTKRYVHLARPKHMVTDHSPLSELE